MKREEERKRKELGENEKRECKGKLTAGLSGEVGRVQESAESA